MWFHTWAFAFPASLLGTLFLDVQMAHSTPSMCLSRMLLVRRNLVISLKEAGPSSPTLSIGLACCDCFLHRSLHLWQSMYFNCLLIIFLHQQKHMFHEVRVFYLLSYYCIPTAENIRIAQWMSGERKDKGRGKTNKWKSTELHNHWCPDHELPAVLYWGMARLFPFTVVTYYLIKSLKHHKLFN